MNPTIAALGLAAIAGMAAPSRAEESTCWVFFGTSATDSRSGLYRSSLNEDTGALSPAVRVTKKPDSEFMAFSPDQSHLYSLSQVPGPGRFPLEAIESYAVDASTGALTALGERVVDGSESCHISVDPSGRCVLTADYDGPYVEAFPIGADHTVGKRTCIIRHSGHGPDASRQGTSHPHSINVDPSGRFAVVPDLGLDRLYIYRLDAARATLSPNEPPYAEVAPGSGPRHFKFDSDGRHAFVINEMAATITAFIWDAEKGSLTPYQTIPILNPDYQGPTNTAAEVAIGKSGRFIYGSNRGDDSIVVLSFEPESGQLAFVQRMAEGVKVPRNFAIDPTGKWLVCGNLRANNATVYRIDANSGRLSLAGSLPVPEPLCVRFLEAR